MTSRTQKKPPPADAGFTLIELLVSMAILAAILGSLVAGLRLLSSGWDRNTQRLEALDMVARTLDILQRDAAGLQRVVAQVGMEQQYLFEGDAGGMSLVVLEPPFPTDAGAYFVNYAAGEVNGEAGLIRARAPYHHEMLRFPGATPANRVALLQGPYLYQFSYGEKTAREIRWSAGWSNRNRLPHLIRLQISDLSETPLLLPPIVVPLRADAELNCLTRGQGACSARNRGDLKAETVRPGAP